MRDFGPHINKVRSAFEEWDALELPVRFVFVSDSASAEVHVNWVDHFNEPISGRTRWARDDDWIITDANIVLAIHHNQGEQLDEAAMRAMAMHEIGHLLGLDHTTDNMSIMAGCACASFRTRIARRCVSSTLCPRDRCPIAKGKGASR